MISPGSILVWQYDRPSFFTKDLLDDDFMLVVAVMDEDALGIVNVLVIDMKSVYTVTKRLDLWTVFPCQNPRQ